MDKQPAIIIYSDGSTEVVGQIAIGAVQVAVQRLTQTIAGFVMGPQPQPPQPPKDEADDLL